MLDYARTFPSARQYPPDCWLESILREPERSGEPSQCRVLTHPVSPRSLVDGGTSVYASLRILLGDTYSCGLIGGRALSSAALSYPRQPLPCRLITTKAPHSLSRSRTPS